MRKELRRARREAQLEEYTQSVYRFEYGAENLRPRSSKSLPLCAGSN
jgi:hypothetical protein